MWSRPIEHVIRIGIIVADATRYQIFMNRNKYEKVLEIQPKPENNQYWMK